MFKIGKDGDDLVSVPKGGDEWDDRGVAGEIVEEREFVLDTRGGGGDIYFFDGDELGFADGGGVGGVVSVGGRRRGVNGGGGSLVVDVPGVIIAVIEEVFGFVDGGESAWVG